MAYISQEKKKKIADALKAAGIPKTFKYTLAVDHRSELILTIRSAPATVLDDFIGHLNSQGYPEQLRDGEKSNLERFEESGEWNVNQYYMERQFKGRTLKVLQTMLETIKTAGDWFDKSDAMSDYFHTAFYITIRFGKWDKPCEFTGRRRAKPSLDDKMIGAAAGNEADAREVRTAFAKAATGYALLSSGRADGSSRPLPHQQGVSEPKILQFPVGGGKPLREPSLAEKREIARTEMLRRYKAAFAATPVGANLSDAALATLAEAALKVTVE